MERLPEGIDAHRVASKLWIGSQPTETACNFFDVVVLCADEYQPSLRCAVHAGFDDNGSPSLRDVRTALRAAKTVQALRSKGKRVLVSCWAGVNRSSLVAALAMTLDGISARDAIRTIRKHRKPPNGMMPLSNRGFVRIIVGAEKIRRKRYAAPNQTT